MRRGYFDGAPGIAASGIVWLVSGLVGTFGPAGAAVLALLIGGMAIHPIGVLLARALGSPGKHAEGNPLARLAAEGTFWMFAGIAVAYGVYVLRSEWFFPVMLLVIGGRYLTFQTIYGLRIYWPLGAVLCFAGVGLAVLRAPVPVSAFTGAAVELVFAVLVFAQARRSLA